MPTKSKSHSEPLQVAPTAKKKNTSHKKVISCHCWPGVYEAAQRIMNEYAHDELNDEKLSMSKFINIIIRWCSQSTHRMINFIKKRYF